MTKVMIIYNCGFKLFGKPLFNCVLGLLIAGFVIGLIGCFIVLYMTFDCCQKHSRWLGDGFMSVSGGNGNNRDVKCLPLCTAVGACAGLILSSVGGITCLPLGVALGASIGLLLYSREHKA